ncbi:hypothetical protein LIER_29739 [Lithospermum erythrorhizon]|uniref:Uncharacterized protein n=1 Tax=Lithospermum erythrorhizon TaxID=34254 RepID=A0AAV3RK80_LITER
MAITPNHLVINAPTKSNPEISLLHNSSISFMETIKFFDFQKVAPTFTQPGNITMPTSSSSGGRLLKSKKLLSSDFRYEDNLDLDLMAKVARQPSRSP